MRRALGLAGILIVAGLAGWLGRSREAPSGSERGDVGPAAAQEAAARAAPAELVEPEPLATSPARAEVRGEGEAEAEAAAAVPAGKVVLEGRVVDRADAAAAPVPAVGASVVQFPKMGFGSDEDQPRTTTGDGGAFRLEVEDPGTRPFALRLLAEEDEVHRHAEATVLLEEGERYRGGIVLERFAHGPLSGRTIDVAGRAVPDVDVTLETWDPTGSFHVPMASARSDAGGRFRFEGVRWFEGLTAAKPGYVLLEAVRPDPIDGGGWEPLDVVLGGSAELSVRVVGPAGEPFPGVDVAVTVADAERYAPQGWGQSLSEPRRATTGADGAALLEGVWASQRLHVSLQRRSGEELEFALGFERVDGTRPVLPPERAGAPIVLEHGEARALEIRLAARLRLVGRVLLPDGTGVANALVTARGLEDAPYEPWKVTYRARGDAEGRFSLELAPTRPLGRVLVSASDATNAWGIEPPSRRTSRVVDLTGRTDGEEELVLELAPTLAIAGRVNSDPAVRTTVRATPSREPGAAPWDDGAHHDAQVRDDGTFRIRGLSPGRYDLEVTPSERFALVRVSGVEAGTEGVNVTLDRPRPVRLVVETTLAGGEARDTILLHGRLRPRGEPPDAPELPRESVRREPGGWPSGLGELWSGAGGHSDELGWTLYLLRKMKESPTTLELDEGCYWLGAKAVAQDGNYSFPVGTGLVHLTEGEYRLRFELGSTGAVEGFVRERPPDRELFAALAHDGGLLELDVDRRETDVVRELGADGFFRFPRVPAGPLELRVGTLEELLAGRWTHTLDLDVGRGATVSVEVPR